RPRNHALAEAMDARRWDAEAPLGRTVLVAHAAFLHAGFVPYGNPAAHRFPGRTMVWVVSSPQPCNAADTAVLRLCAHGDFLILYGYLASGGSRPGTRWARVIARGLSGDLGAVACTLANDELGARLRNTLAGALARRLFADICAENAALLPSRLTLLPADLQAAILGKLAGAILVM
uniref:Uncharacterized protein n=1 Tax=Setaria italica TaxID=4555 RepID=K4AK59_SETIT